MKRTPLRRYTPLTSKGGGLKRSPIKRGKRPVKVKNGRNKGIGAGSRPKLPKFSTVRNKCDSKLTPLIQKIHPYCLLRGSQNCAGVTQVAHHHVHKSKSSHLRYDLENLIPLCGACHVMLHNDESYWGAKVAQIKGPEWFNYISENKHKQVKADVHFYLSHLSRLEELLKTL